MVARIITDKSPQCRQGASRVSHRVVVRCAADLAVHCSLVCRPPSSRLVSLRNRSTSCCSAHTVQSRPLLRWMHSLRGRRLELLPLLLLSAGCAIWREEELEMWRVQSSEIEECGEGIGRGLLSASSGPRSRWRSVESACIRGASGASFACSAVAQPAQWWARSIGTAAPSRRGVPPLTHALKCDRRAIHGTRRTGDGEHSEENEGTGNTAGDERPRRMPKGSARRFF